jgi:hypothetical protein
MNVGSGSDWPPRSPSDGEHEQEKKTQTFDELMGEFDGSDLSDPSVRKIIESGAAEEALSGAVSSDEEGGGGEPRERLPAGIPRMPEPARVEAPIGVSFDEFIAQQGDDMAEPAVQDLLRQEGFQKISVPMSFSSPLQNEKIKPLLEFANEAFVRKFEEARGKFQTEYYEHLRGIHLATVRSRLLVHGAHPERMASPVRKAHKAYTEARDLLAREIVLSLPIPEDREGREALREQKGKILEAFYLEEEEKIIELRKEALKEAREADVVESVFSKIRTMPTWAKRAVGATGLFAAMAAGGLFAGVSIAGRKIAAAATLQWALSAAAGVAGTAGGGFLGDMIHRWFEPSKDKREAKERAAREQIEMHLHDAKILSQGDTVDDSLKSADEAAKLYRESLLAGDREEVSRNRKKLILAIGIGSTAALAIENALSVADGTDVPLDGEGVESSPESPESFPEEGASAPDDIGIQEIPTYATDEGPNDMFFRFLVELKNKDPESYALIVHDGEASINAAERLAEETGFWDRMGEHSATGLDGAYLSNNGDGTILFHTPSGDTLAITSGGKVTPDTWHYEGPMTNDA